MPLPLTKPSRRYKGQAKPPLLLAETIARRVESGWSSYKVTKMEAGLCRCYHKPGCGISEVSSQRTVASNGRVGKEVLETPC